MLLALAGCRRKDAIGSDNPEVREMIRQIRAGDANERRQAARKLGELGDQAAVEPLVEALDDHQAAVQLEAARALGKLKSPKATESLIDALNDETMAVRKAAADALGDIGDPQAADRLIGLLTDENLPVRIAAAEALGRLRGGDVPQKLLEALKSENPRMQQGAALALGYIGDGQAADALAEHTRSEDPEMRLTAASALARLGDNRAVDVLARFVYQPIDDAKAREFEERINGPIPPQRRREIIDKLRSSGKVNLQSNPRYPHEAKKRKERIEQEIQYIRKLIARPIDDQRRQEIIEIFVQRSGEDTWQEMNSEQRQVALETEIERLESMSSDPLSDGKEQAVIDFMHRRAGRETWNALSEAEREKLIREQYAQPIRREREVYARQKRLSAAEAIGRTGTVKAAKALLSAMGSRNRQVKQVATEALRNLGGAAAETLVSFVGDSKQPLDERRRAMPLLVRIKDDRATEALIQLLDDPDDQIRAEAAAALAQESDPKVAQAMLPLVTDKVARIRRAAVQRLGREKDASAKVGKALMRALDDPDPDVRAMAAAGLGNVGYKPAVDKLIQIIETTDTSENEDLTSVVLRSAESLGKLGNKKAVKPLMHLLNGTPHKWTRAAAARALGRLQAEESKELLALQLKKLDWHSGPAAAWALGEFNDPAYIDVLASTLDQKRHMDKLKDASKAKRERDSFILMGHFGKPAIAALGKIEDPRAVEALMKVLREMSVEFKREAVKALINQGERAIPQLAEALNDEDRDYREAASQVLWGIGEPAVPALIRTARDGSSGAKLVAIGALGGMQAEDAVDVLIEDLQDEDENVRAAAAWALGQIQTGKAIDPLTRAMDDPSSKVQSAAENALRQIKSGVDSGSPA